MIVRARRRAACVQLFVETGKQDIVAALESTEHILERGQVNAVEAAEVVALGKGTRFATDRPTHWDRQEPRPVRLELGPGRREDPRAQCTLASASGQGGAGSGRRAGMSRSRSRCRPTSGRRPVLAPRRTASRCYWCRRTSGNGGPRSRRPTRLPRRSDGQVRTDTASGLTSRPGRAATLGFHLSRPLDGRVAPSRPWRQG